MKKEALFYSKPTGRWEKWGLKEEGKKMYLMFKPSFLNILIIELTLKIGIK